MTQLGELELIISGDSSRLQQELKRGEQAARSSADRMARELAGGMDKAADQMRGGQKFDAAGRAAGAAVERGFLSSNFRKLGGRIADDIGGGIKSGLGGMKGAFGNVFQGIFQGIGQGITNIIVGAIRSVASYTFDFSNLTKRDTATRQVSTLTDDVGGAVKVAASLSKELKRTVSTTEALAASYDVLSAGFTKAADSANILSAAQKGAIGGQSDLNTVANATTTILNAYGMAAGRADEVVNQMIGTQNAGKIVVGEYASLIGQVASTAAAAGVELDTMNAFIATATVKGVQAGPAITGLRQAISNTLKPAADSAKFAKSLGIEFGAAALQSKGLDGILKELSDRGLATAENLVKLFGSTEAVAAILPSAGDGVKDFAKNLETIRTTKADDAFNKMADSAENLAKKNAVLREEMDIKFKSSIAPIFQAGTRALNVMMEHLLESSGLFDELTAQSEEFARYLDENPEIAREMGDVLAGLVAESLSQVLSLSRELLGYLQKNPQAIREAIEGVKQFASALGTVLQTAAQIVSTLAEAAQGFAAVAQGGAERVGQNNAIEATSLSDQDKAYIAQETERRLQQRKKPKLGGNWEFLLPGSEDRIRRQIMSDVHAEVSAKVRAQQRASGGSGGGGGTTAGGAKLSESELNQLAALAIMEAPTRQGRLDVTQAVFNRINSKKAGGANFGNNVTEVAFASGQFEPYFGVNPGQVQTRDDAVKILQQKRGMSAAQSIATINEYLADLQDAAKMADAARHVGGRTDFKGTTQIENRVASEDPQRYSNENFFHINESQNYGLLKKIAAMSPGAISTGGGGGGGGGAPAPSRSASATPSAGSSADYSNIGKKVAEQALTMAGREFAPGLTEQCANFVRDQLQKAGVKVGITSKPIDGLETGSALASSFFGEDIGEIIKDKSKLMAGDILAFGGTYGNYSRDTITHTGIYTGNGKMVDRSTSAKPVSHRSIDTFEGPNSGFLYAVRPKAYGVPAGAGGGGGGRGSGAAGAVDLDAIEREDAERQRAIEAARSKADQRLQLERETARKQLEAKREAERVRLEGLRDRAPNEQARGVLERQIGRGAVSNQYEDKLTELKQELADLMTARTQKIQDGETGGADYSAAIKQTQQLIAQTEKLGQVELKNFDAGQSVAAGEAAIQQQRQLAAEATTRAYEEQRLALEQQAAAAPDDFTKQAIQFDIDALALKHETDEALRPLREQLEDAKNTEAFLVQVGAKGSPELTQVRSEIKGIEEAIAGVNTAAQTQKAILNSGFAQFMDEATLGRKQAELGRDQLLAGSEMGLLQAQAGNIRGNGGDEFAAVELEKQAALMAEQLSYRQAMLQIEQQIREMQAAGTPLAESEVATLRQQAEALHEINLDSIGNQFKSLGDTIKDTTMGAFNQFFQGLLTGSQTAGEAFQGLISSILSSLANLAINRIFSELFGGGGGGGLFGGGGGGGGLGGGGGGLLSAGAGLVGSILGFEAGGRVPAVPMGDYRKGSGPIAEALRKEGPNSVLAALRPDELVLTVPQAREFHSLGLDKVLNFAQGGIVPGGSGAPPRMRGLGSNNVTVPVTVEGGADPQLNVPRLQASIRAAVVSELHQQRRNGGVLSS